MKHTCSSCNVLYRVISDEADDDDLEAMYCPFCGEEQIEELNFNDE